VRSVKKGLRFVGFRSLEPAGARQEKDLSTPTLVLLKKREGGEERKESAPAGEARVKEREKGLPSDL